MFAAKWMGVFARRAAMFALVMAGASGIGSALTIQQSIVDQGSGTYQYSFYFNGPVLLNQEVAIFFPYFDGVVNTSGTSSILDLTAVYPNANWTSVILQPDPGLPDNGVWSLVSTLDQPVVTGPIQISIEWMGPVAPDALMWTLSNTDGAGTILNLVAQGTTETVPEPGTWLLSVGVVALVAYRRRKA